MTSLFYKGLLTLSLAVISTVSFAQYDCDQMIQKPGFEICYNYELKAPLWTKHEMVKADLQAKGHSRKGIRFYEEVAIPKRHRATLADFRRSGYDRGHMVSNDDLNHNRKLQKATFSLANITAQAPKANRGIIRYTEKLLRKLTVSNQKSLVITGAVYKKINPKRIGPGQVAVPSHLYKIIYLPNQKPLAFLIPNKNVKMGNKPSKFRTSLDEIEKLTGLRKFFNYNPQSQISKNLSKGNGLSQK